MKKKHLILGLLSLGVVLFPGCVAFPPLIQVEHKESAASNQEIMKRLDAIDHRLDQLEQKGGQK